MAALRADPDSEVQGTAARSLGWLGGAARAAGPDLIAALSSKTFWIRQDAAQALGRIGSDASANQLAISRALAVSLSDPDSTTRAVAASALREIGVAAQPQNLKALHSPDSFVRITAIQALGEQPPTPASIAGLSALLSAKDSITRAEAVAALGGFGPGVLPQLRRAIAGKGKSASDGVARVVAYIARVDSLPLASACYGLQLGKWDPVLNIGDDSEFSTPPAVVSFSRVKSEGFGSYGGKVSYRVLPTNGARMSVHGPGFWTPQTRTDSVSIVWTTGFSGLTMSLGVTTDTLSGTARTFWDFPRTRQTAKVLGVRVACHK